MTHSSLTAWFRSGPIALVLAVGAPATAQVPPAAESAAARVAEPGQRTGTPTRYSPRRPTQEPATPAPAPPQEEPEEPAEPARPTPEPTRAPPSAAEQASAPAAGSFAARPVTSWLEAQIALARLRFSCGSIDGVAGPQSAAALRAFQRRAGLRETGWLDRATGAELVLTEPPLTTLALPVEEFARFRPVSPTWLGKSEQPALAYESALEWAAEQSHAHPKLIRQLNPEVDWARVLPGARFTVPAVGAASGPAAPPRAARVVIRLAEHTLQMFDEAGEVIAHAPVSIARRVEKRPAGELRVTVVILDPDYTFDPAIFPESAEGRELGRKLWIPPGPNNPVGRAWIGLDRPGYGIHGTPQPESVGRTESHGCFRLANWDAQTVAALAWVGLPVRVEP